MKKLRVLLILCVLCLLACQSNKTLGTDQHQPDDFENRFFTLNFESEEIILKDFTDQFFTSFPHNDPTLGDVVYDRANWVHDDLIQLKERNGLFAYLKYREDNKAFDSFRFTSKSYYNLNEGIQQILFVFKGKLPSANGMWPAWWLNGSHEKEWTYRDSIPALTDEALKKYSGVGNFYDTPSAVNCTDWPGAGEIDIIENINGDDKIHNTLHTCPQMCDSEWNGDGTVINCANTKPGNTNPGCTGNTYNLDQVEGTFACIWEEDLIRFYYWNPGSNVAGAGGPLSEEPNPELWNDAPLKNTVKLLETDLNCEDGIHQTWQCKNCENRNKCRFQNMKMIFNVTLCGVWAGNVFDETPNAFQNCQEYIRGIGKDFIDNKFMKIEYISIRNL